MRRKNKSVTRNQIPHTREGRKFIFFWLLVTGVWFQVCNDACSQPTVEELKGLAAIRGKVKGRIVFSSRRGPFWGVWRMNADGSGLRRLTGETSHSRNPVWVEDGGKILFNSNREGRWQIYAMDSDGGRVENLSRSGESEILCSVTRDQSKIFFQTRENGPMRLFVRETKTREIHEIDFSEFPGRAGKMEPKISPDGKKIAFLFKDGHGASRSVYVGDLDAVYKVENVIPIHLGCFSAWSKDSSRFIMCVFTPGGTALHLASADGSGLTPLTAGGRWNYFPAWSPDEEWFLWAASPTPYHDFDSGQYDLYIASTKDKKPIRLTFHPDADLEPSWGPEKP